MPPAVGYADTNSATTQVSYGCLERQAVVLPELAIRYAMTEPTNQHHTAVAGPPEFKGLPIVAGTEPKTPRMEIA